MQLALLQTNQSHKPYDDPSNTNIVNPRILRVLCVMKDVTVVTIYDDASWVPASLW